MSQQSRSPEEKFLHSYASRMIDIELNKAQKMSNALEKKSSLPVFVLSSLFIAAIYGMLVLSRSDSSSILSEFIVNVGFNFLFTYGFSLALLHAFMFPSRLNMYLDNAGKDDLVQSDKKFYLSMFIGIILTMIISVTLYHMWILGEAIHPIADIAILIGLFIHMMRGLHFWYMGKQLFKIQKTFINEMKVLIDEFEIKRRDMEEETPID